MKKKKANGSSSISLSIPPILCMQVCSDTSWSFAVVAVSIVLAGACFFFLAGMLFPDFLFCLALSFLQTNHKFS